MAATDVGVVPRAEHPNMAGVTRRQSWQLVRAHDTSVVAVRVSRSQLWLMMSSPAFRGCQFGSEVLGSAGRSQSVSGLGEEGEKKELS